MYRYLFLSENLNYIGKDLERESIEELEQSLEKLKQNKDDLAQHLEAKTQELKKARDESVLMEAERQSFIEQIKEMSTLKDEFVANIDTLNDQINVLTATNECLDAEKSDLQE